MAVPEKSLIDRTASAAPPRDDGTGLIDLDPWLTPYADALHRRYCKFQEVRRRLVEAFGSLESAALGHMYFGFNRGECDRTAGHR